MVLVFDVLHSHHHLSKPRQFFHLSMYRHQACPVKTWLQQIIVLAVVEVLLHCLVKRFFLTNLRRVYLIARLLLPYRSKIHNKSPWIILGCRSSLINLIFRVRLKAWRMKAWNQMELFKHSSPSCFSNNLSCHLPNEIIKLSHLKSRDWTKVKWRKKIMNWLRKTVRMLLEYSNWTRLSVTSFANCLQKLSQTSSSKRIIPPCQALKCLTIRRNLWEPSCTTLKLSKSSIR